MPTSGRAAGVSTVSVFRAVAVIVVPPVVWLVAVGRDGSGPVESAGDGVCGFLRAAGVREGVVVDPPAGVVVDESRRRGGQHDHRVHDRAAFLDEDAHGAVWAFADV